MGGALAGDRVGVHVFDFPRQVIGTIFSLKSPT